MKIGKKKTNQNLVVVLIVSAVLHIIAFTILGSVVIFQAVTQSEPEFEAAAVPIAIEPEQLQVRSNMRQRTQSGMTRAQPQQRITVSNPQMAQVQALSMTVAPPAAGVSLSGVGTGTLGSGTGSGSGLGALGGTGGIGVGMRSVSFLGVQSGGERVAIIVDCSNHMLLDEKGGLHAFRLVKDECIKVIEALDPGVVFNIYLFSGNKTVNRFKPHMVTTSPAMIREVKAWLSPINENVSALGARTDNFKPDREYFQGGGGYTFSNFARALHASFEDQAEAIFMIVANWANIRQHIDDFDGTEKNRIQNDLNRRIRDWERNHQAAREKWLAEVWRPAQEKAREILKAENERRRAAGRPPRVVLTIDHVVNENKLVTGARPPSRPVLPYYTPEEIIMKFRREMYRDYYREKQKELPSINIILFGQDDKAEANFRRLVSTSRSGNFRTIPSLAELESASSRSREHREERAR